MAPSIALLMFPEFTQLDLTGPYEVFARIPGARVHAVAATEDPVRSDSGLRLLPDTVFSEVGSVDVICVPGGPGVNGAVVDPHLLDFVGRVGRDARFVTSVCSGALVLGAAGLLRGFRATTHWLSLELLPHFGAIPVADRVVVDRNRITGGGVTAGIDFGLIVAAALAGEEVARRIQLMLEYAPAPPFDAGHPSVAGPEVVTAVRAEGAAYLDSRRAIIAKLGQAQ